MIKVALANKEAIKAYSRRHSDLDKDILSDEDWSVLCNIHDFLDELRQTTLDLEDSTSTLDSVLPAMDYVLEKFESFKEDHKDDPILAPMFNSGWAKMEKYHSLTDRSSAYIGSVVLNPTFKWKYIEENWDAEWVPNAKRLMKQLWDSYKPTSISTASITSTTTSSASTERPKKLIQNVDE
jgi:hypothetical protein